MGLDFYIGERPWHSFMYSTWAGICSIVRDHSKGLNVPEAYYRLGLEGVAVAPAECAAIAAFLHQLNDAEDHLHHWLDALIDICETSVRLNLPASAH